MTAVDETGEVLSEISLSFSLKSKMSDRQKSAKAKKQNHLEGLIDAREGRVSRLDQFEVIEFFIERHHL